MATIVTEPNFPDPSQCVQVSIDPNGQLGKVSTNAKDVVNVVEQQPTDVIYQLNPVTFNFPNSQITQYDLLANEVATVIPDAVVNNGQTPSNIKYTALISLLINAVKSQKKQIDILTAQCARIEQMETAIHELFIRIK